MRILTAISGTMEKVKDDAFMLNRALGKEAAFGCHLVGDAVVVALDRSGSGPANLRDLLDIVRKAQAHILREYGFLLRGGISEGDVTLIDGCVTGNGVSRAETVSGDDNPSFLIRVDDRLLEELRSWVKGMYDDESAESVLSNYVLQVEGHWYIRYLDEGVTPQRVVDTVAYYQSQPGGDDPKVIARHVCLIEMFNSQDLYPALRYRIVDGRIEFG